MPTKEQQAVYNATKKAKRKKDRFEAMPEAQALRAELGALQRGIAGEQVYMGSADYESTLRERVELLPFGAAKTRKECLPLLSLRFAYKLPEPARSRVILAL